MRLDNQTLLKLFHQIIHVDHSKILFSLSQLFAELFLQVLRPQHIILNVVLLVILLSLRKITLKLKIQGSLVLLKVDFPPVEVFQLKISDIIDLDQSFKVFVQVVIVFLAELLTTKIGYLSHSFDQRGALARILTQLMVFNQVFDDYLTFLGCISFANIEQLRNS